MRRRQTFLDTAAGTELVLPVTPASYAWEDGINVNAVTVEGLGDLNLPGYATAPSQTIDCLLPAHEYAFAEPEAGTDPQVYLKQLRDWCAAGTVLRYLVDGAGLNTAVILESITAREQDGTNNIRCAITLRAYRAPEVLDVTDSGKKSAQVLSSRSSDGGSAGGESGVRTHTVASGDTLWALCQKYYGKASMALCRQVAAYNGLKNVNILTVGKVLKFPDSTKLPDGSAVSSDTQRKTDVSKNSVDDDSQEGQVAATGGTCAVSLTCAGISRNWGDVTMRAAYDGTSHGSVTIGASTGKDYCQITPKRYATLTVTPMSSQYAVSYWEVNGIKCKYGKAKHNFIVTADMTIAIHWAAR